MGLVRCSLKPPTVIVLAVLLFRLAVILALPARAPSTANRCGNGQALFDKLKLSAWGCVK